MTPIYGYAFCHGPVTAAVTSRDKMPFLNLKVSRPFTLDVTVLGLIYSVKTALSRPSRRNGIKILKRQMWVNREKRGVPTYLPRPKGNSRDGRDSANFKKDTGHIWRY